ncbi:MAG: tRNA pseudouridine(38-40) synthase TruA [Chloroflexi bacterium]|nr:tRNA pseudouridine(38-40) synthase TruA [Chloroflexota bacterium]
MALYQAWLAYDGTAFAGLQRQARARTVQGVLEQALRALGWQEAAIRYAGRTDAGVHALGQVVAFRLTWRHGAEALLRALNAHLPADVTVWHVREAPEGFHPRYAALGRRYVYWLWCSAVRHPFQERYAWRVWPCPSADALNRAAAQLVGRHDFAALGTPPAGARGTTVRTVYRATWYPVVEGLWAFDVAADAFLYRMVRRMVAAQVALAQGRIPWERWARAFTEPPAQPWAVLAPPQGLFLAEVAYDPATLRAWQSPTSVEAFRAWWWARWRLQPPGREDHG